jgi:hypothetical protein
VITQVLRHQLPPADREVLDLHYLDPTRADFARNVVTDLFNTHSDGADRPLVSIYAAPTQPVEVGLGALLRRVQDQGLSTVEPATRSGPLVPGLCRPFSSGVIAHDGNRGPVDVGRAFVLRTSGSVELVDGEATAASEGRSALYLRHTLIRTAQVMSYLFLFGERIERDEWTVLVNIRNARRAQLDDVHERYARTFSTDPHVAIERHLQFRAIAQRADEDLRRRIVQRLDEFLSFAYGFTEPRGHDTSGMLVAS